MKFPANLLSIDTNAKTVKGQKYGFMTGILYLAPADLSGYQVCPMAEIAGCVDACLNTAGRGAFNSIQQARVNKTKLFFEHQADFMSRIARDIEKLIKKASKLELIPLVRLNGTSDIRWENVPVTYNGKHYANIMDCFPLVQFYDYTKIPNRKRIPSNYDLTFSYSDRAAYQQYVQRAIDNGERIAAVFRTQAGIPAHFRGLPVVNGDNSDIRHLDPRGHIVALYAKGKAKRDTSGFVIG